MSIFEQEETREQKMERIAKEKYAKQAIISKRILRIVFGSLGLFFIAMGLIMMFVDTGDPDSKIVGYIFTPMGAIWLFIGLVLPSLFPNNLNYAKYKEQVEKYGLTSTTSMALEIEIQRASIEQLQNEVEELKHQVEQLKNDGYRRY